MGGKNWQRLHRLIYVSAVAGVIHYYWLVKSDIRMPVLYGVILLALILLRPISKRISQATSKKGREAPNKPVTAA